MAPAQASTAARGMVRGAQAANQPLIEKPGTSAESFGAGKFGWPVSSATASSRSDPSRSCPETSPRLVMKKSTRPPMRSTIAGAPPR